jgi:hypothetical protein
MGANLGKFGGNVTDRGVIYASTMTADSQHLTGWVDHYSSCLSLGLTAGEKSDLIQYLLSLTFGPEQGARRDRAGERNR